MDDLAAMLHPWTCWPHGPHNDGTLPADQKCHRAAAAIAPRLTPDREALTVEMMAGALYETDPPESWMRTGTDEYRKRAAAMLAFIADEFAASQPVPTEPEEAS